MSVFLGSFVVFTLSKENSRLPWGGPPSHWRNLSVFFVQGVNAEICAGKKQVWWISAMRRNFDYTIPRVKLRLIVKRNITRHHFLNVNYLVLAAHRSAYLSNFWIKRAVWPLDILICEIVHSQLHKPNSQTGCLDINTVVKPLVSIHITTWWSDSLSPLSPPLFHIY